MKSKKKVHESIARNSTAGKKDPNEYLVEVEESREQVAILDPRDFKLPAAPSDFKFELPYEGARYKIAEPVDFSKGQELSVTAKNPHERYVGRKVRKAFRIRRKVNKDEEEVDFLELCVSVVSCKRKWNILWNVRVFRGINKALKQQPRPIRLSQ